MFGQVRQNPHFMIKDEYSALKDMITIAYHGFVEAKKSQQPTQMAPIMSGQGQYSNQCPDCGENDCQGGFWCTKSNPEPSKSETPCQWFTTTGKGKGSWNGNNQGMNPQMQALQNQNNQLKKNAEDLKRKIHSASTDSSNGKSAHSNATYHTDSDYLWCSEEAKPRSVEDPQQEQHDQERSAKCTAIHTRTDTDKRRKHGN